MAFLSDAAGGWGDDGYQGFWGPAMLVADPDQAVTDGRAPNEFYNRFG